MNPVEIPLLKILLRLFYSLRQCGFPLGVEDYIFVLQALQGGFGISDRASLERLCCTLWAKSEQDARKLHQLFDRIVTELQNADEKSSTAKSPQTVKERSKQLPSETSLTDTQEFVPEAISPTNLPLEIDEPEQIIQAIRHYKPNSLETIYYSQDSAADYLPVTSRQIKQSWRLLRRPVCQGTLQKLDVAATVEKICRQGILLQPVLMPRYVNRVKLVLLVDQGGSMVPFHHLSRQLIDKALRGGNIEQTSVYYFYNYPEKYLYSDPTRIKAQLTTNALESIGEKAGVFIVSDAGSARGNYNSERVDYTQKFIEQLRQSVRYYAWLNPMPNDSWRYSTAGEIARFVPMFEMSRQGFNAAINTLRGRYVYWERPYQWML